MKKLTILCLAMASTLFTACGDNNSSVSESGSVSESSVSETVAETESESETENAEESDAETSEDEENYDTGDASLDNVRNQNEIGENELLVVSFGTSFNDSRRLTIGAIENALETEFPDYSVRRGFTAHPMNGLEYNDIIDEVAQYSDAFEKVAFGEPLLTSDDDFKRVEQAIVDWTAEYDDGKTAICFMGHGTEAESNGVYQKMQDLLIADGYENYFIGTVEAEPSIDTILAKVKDGEYEKVVLEPLMVVCGDHANNDMAGDEEDSWKSVFEAEGYEVECILRGLGENEDIRQIYVDHAQTAIDSIK